MPRYRLKLAALALLMLAATATPSAASAQEAPPDPAQQAANAARLAACTAAPAPAPAPGTPLTINGKGRLHSAPFTLDGGAYTVDWSAADVSGVPLLYLQSTTDALVLEPLLGGIGPGVNAGQTHLYKIKPGSYYLNVGLPAGWSVTFTPIAV